MPSTLEIRVDDRQLRFSDQLTVEVIGAGPESLPTTWESVSREKENEISFQFPDETRTSLKVEYAFNDRNQLVLKVPAQPGVVEASGEWTLQGRIFVDDSEDLVYRLLDEEGELTDRFLEVYGHLSLPENDPTRLRVRFGDETETFIKGNRSNKSLSASEYLAGGDLARDLLRFNATTRNTIGGADQSDDAEIKFYGRWDMHENALVFVTKYDNTGLEAPLAYLAIGGQVKGTNYGLVVEKGGAVALQINGRYEWNRATLGWDLKIGYSKAAGLEARLQSGATINGRHGVLTIQGGATLLKGPQAQSLVVDLAISYTTKNGSLKFEIEAGPNGYEMHLSGNFKIQNSHVKFELEASNKDGGTIKGTVDFGLYTNNVDLKLSLETVLTRNGLTLAISMEFRFYWGPSGPVAQLPG